MNSKSKFIDIDLVVDPRPLTEAEQQAISDFIRADKAKRMAKLGPPL